MKKTILIIAFLTTRIGFSQCTINSNIQADYKLDVKILALREILDNPSDPDYDNPFLPNARTTPYLEKLSAIYENPNNNPVLDSLFNEFDIHVNKAMNAVAFKNLSFMVDTSVEWVDDFKNTGVSGVPALDNLMATYGFSISNSIELSSSGNTIFSLTTNFDFLNIQALVDDFVAINDINYPSPDYPFMRLNYTGIPYEIDGEWFSDWATACDIRVEGDIFTFGIYGGDCPSGCQLEKLWKVKVDDNCNVTLLSTPENSFTEFSLYPNPVSEKLYFEGLPRGEYLISIFSIKGKFILETVPKSKELDVSSLENGIYFVKIIRDGKTLGTEKLVKF